MPDDGTIFTGQSKCFADLPSGTGGLKPERVQAIKSENQRRDAGT